MRRELFVFFFVFLLAISFVSAAEVNQTEKTKAYNCLRDSRTILNELSKNNFSIERLNSTFLLAQNLYDAQLVLEGKNKKTEYSLIFPHCDEIQVLRDQAFDAIDSFEAILRFYDESLDESMNTTSADLIIEEIETEIASERYERIAPLINEGYEVIIDIQSSSTALNFFISSTTRGIKEVFLDYWLQIVIGIVVLIVLFLFYRTAIFTYLVKRKIRSLEHRKDVLKKLIMNTQKEYFNKGDMSESNYTIRTKKFAELARDIDRQIPLLHESLIKLSKKKDLSKVEWGK